MAGDGAFPAKTFEDWSRLASTELKGKPVASLDWETPEGIRVKPLYTAEDLAAIERDGVPLRDMMPGYPPICADRARPCQPAVDDPAICRVLDGRGVEPVLSREFGGGADGAVDRLRPRHPSRLTTATIRASSRCRQGGGGDRLGRGHEDPVRAASARP